MSFMSDGAPRPSAPQQQPGFTPEQYVPAPDLSSQRDEEGPGRFTDRVTAKVNNRVTRITNFEGSRGHSARTALIMKWTAYFLIVLGASGITEALTANVTYASHGGLFMLISATLVAFVGAVSTVFYVNLRNELIEKVRHYIFGLMVIPGLIMALFVRLVAEWEWANTGSIGSTLQMALPMVFLATVVLPAFIFVKELLGMRTIYRSKLDDQEAVALWTRQDGLQR